ncbi:Vacuolar protein sorting-associated protein 62 [Macleaya cordata]|uniref:Vacuolar protein sorting-associated protein 62 n=1 Tax=Macleaya cordata TaxID=56857 RepID=A0A200QFX9_MACCD|nr:Vacuolar protein sorting-associated protein 62 [Macleaya cordata]
MGNLLSLGRKRKALPIATKFNLPSPLPSWPQSDNGGFASGGINLGGLEVHQISTFTKVWAILEGGPNNIGATFFEPSLIPDGYFMLGCYSQPNNQPLFGWVLVGKDDGSIEPTSKAKLSLPMDYTLVWSSENSKLKQDGNGYIWLPVPPQGYRAVGHVVTSSLEKPPLDKIRCVHSDLTDSCEHGALIWGRGKLDLLGEINVYGLRPTGRGTRALGVSVGTFIAEINGTGTSSSTLSLSCLKNRDSNFSYMPNLSQIEALVQAYSPLIYFHPNEPYLPSSVSWFFNNGALLYKKSDESNPVSIDPTGSNLPQGGSNDGTYWLDLPVDKGSKEKVKKGDLQSLGSYLHVKPMLGGTFTDIAIWVFYPFNGPSRAKVKFINIKLGRIGEHVGDWEHLTLRISNFNGELQSVYFSQHSKGIWVNSPDLEFQGGNNKVVGYASLNGHAFYPKPGLVLQGNASLNIGIRNDTVNSKIVMDTGERYVVVSAEYLGTIVEPLWLNYAREWGPKIDYEIADELKKIERFLPGKLKSAFKRIVDDLPNEVLGQEGPTGPKMKRSWSEDEAV